MMRIRGEYLINGQYVSAEQYADFLAELFHRGYRLVPPEEG